MKVRAVTIGSLALMPVDTSLAGEPEMLEGMLDAQRAQVGRLLDDLSDGEARLRLVPSVTTPLSLVKHATFVEQVWFHSRVAGVSRDAIGLPDTVDESFALEPGDTVAGVRASFEDACEHSRSVARGRHLDDRFPWHERLVSLRYVYGHMIAELARHAGHGDILVEQIRARRGTA